MPILILAGAVDGIFKPLKEMVEHGVIGLFLAIDSVLYKVVGDIYKLFVSLARVQLLDNQVYEAIANRIYLFVGIIALFVMTFNLLKGLVDPDTVSKGIISSFKNLVISILLVVLLPTIFTYAYSIQAAVLGDNIIEKIFDIDIQKAKSQESTVTVDDLCSVGDKNVEVSAFGTSYKANSTKDITQSECEGNFVIESIMEAFFTPYSDDVVNEYNTKWSDARKYMVYTGNFNYIKTYIENTKKEDQEQAINYKIIISSVAAIAIGYLFLSFSIDIGVRAFKLAFYQLIAPIPVLLKIVPGQEGKFTKWYQQTLQCFLEVFVRLLIVSFAFFMCKNLFVIIDNIFGSKDVNLLGKAVLAIGLFTFGKQAPKLFQDALGISGGNVKLGIRGKLTETPVLGKGFNKAYELGDRTKGAATGALGAAWTSKVNGGTIKDGLKYGAVMGFKNKGNQFNAQRKGLYNELGLKGEAGWFGGQTAIGKKADDVKDTYKDNFYDNILPQKIAKREAKDDWKNTYNNKLNELKSISSKKISDYQSQYSNLEQTKNSEIYKVIEEFENQKLSLNNLSGDEYKQKLAEINSNREMKIASINDNYQSQMNNIDKLIKEEQSLLNGETVKRYNSEGNLEIVNLESQARTFTEGEIGDKDETYKADLKLVAKRNNEKEVEKYLKSVEGQKAAAVQREALDKSKVLKDNIGKSIESPKTDSSKK